MVAVRCDLSIKMHWVEFKGIQLDAQTVIKFVSALLYWLERSSSG